MIFFHYFCFLIYFSPLEFLSRYSFSRYNVTRYSLLRYCVTLSNSPITLFNTLFCEEKPEQTVAFRFHITGKELKGIETTLVAVVLGFSTLSGTNPQFKARKCTTSTPVTFIGEYPPGHFRLGRIQMKMKINLEN